MNAVRANAEITLLDSTKQIVGVVSFRDVDTETIDWMTNLAERGEVKFTLTVKYVDSSNSVNGVSGAQ